MPCCWTKTGNIIDIVSYLNPSVIQLAAKLDAPYDITYSKSWSCFFPPDIL